MSDLISRQTAIELIENEARKWCDEYGISDVLCDLADMPSAQPEIIRCKDCKYYVVHTMFGRSAGWCERNCDEDDKLLAYVTELDDFCSRAESRTV